MTTTPAAKPRRFHTIPLNANHFLGGTLGLSLEGAGAYIKILCLLYLAGGRVKLRTAKDEETLCKQLGLRNPRTLRRALRELILVAGKVEVEDGELLNQRTDDELARAPGDETPAIDCDTGEADGRPPIRGASAYVRQILGLSSGDDRAQIDRQSVDDRQGIDGTSADDRAGIAGPSADSQPITGRSSADDPPMIARSSGNRPSQPIEMPKDPPQAPRVHAGTGAPVSIQHPESNHPGSTARGAATPVDEKPEPDRRAPRFADFAPAPPDTAYGGPDRRARLTGWARENLTGRDFVAWVTRTGMPEDAAAAFDEIESRALAEQLGTPAAKPLCDDSQAPAAAPAEEAQQGEPGTPAPASDPPLTQDALLDLPAFLRRAPAAPSADPGGEQQAPSPAEDQAA